MASDIRDLVDNQIRRAELARRRLAEDGLGLGHKLLPVITISRQLGSGGHDVAVALSELTHFSLWDKQLIEAIAEDSHVANKLVTALDERVISETEILLRHLVGEPKIGGFLYKKHLTRTILQIGRLGNAIIVGRGANFILPQALNVRVVASRDLRVHNLMQSLEIDARSAVLQIDESDKHRSDFSKRLWGRAWDDPLHYDLTIRTDEFEIGEAAQVITAALQFRLVHRVGNTPVSELP